MPNPIAHVEVPVSDLDRASAFYAEVFGFAIERTTIDGYEMGLLPFDPDAPGCSAALARGDVYVPAKAGPVIYLRVPSIAQVIARAEQRGGEVLLPRKSIGDLGFVAEVQDSEGNRIGLLEPLS